MRPGSLGGRLPLLDPAKLSEAQRKVYDRTIATMVPWADAAHFQSRTADKVAIRSLADGGSSEDLSDEERVAQCFVRQLTAEHHVEEPLYRAAEAAFGREGLVAMTFLAGCYQVVCSLLNAFEIPAPASEASSPVE